MNITITDLETNKSLDEQAMKVLTGGCCYFQSPCCQSSRKQRQWTHCFSPSARRQKQFRHRYVRYSKDYRQQYGRGFC